MKLSKERLLREAAQAGFRPEVVEKVIRLLALLDRFARHPFLKDRLALKGGTALNLFLFDLPRLSVDIDLNYVGAADLDTMQEERPNLEHAIQAVCAREGLEISRAPSEHAGGKWRLRYASAFGAHGNLEVDLNYMFRVPLWPPLRRNSSTVGSYGASEILVLDVHELAAGKLAALFARHASRDLFDAHRLLTWAPLDSTKLRLAFVVYGAMNRVDWRTISVDQVSLAPAELENQLIPLIRQDLLKDQKSNEWAAKMVSECRSALKAVLPFTTSECKFLDRILDYGEIHAEHLTKDAELARRIETQPWLQWKATHVKRHKGV